MVAGGNLTNITVNVPSPVAGTDNAIALPFLDMGDYGQLMFAVPTLTPANSAIRIISRSGEFAGGEYHLLSISSPAAENFDFPYSTTFAHEVEFSGTVNAAAWQAVPTGLSATGGTYSFSPVSGASVHSVTFYDSNENTAWGVLLLDGATSFSLPALSSDPMPSGTVEYRVLAADVDGFNASDFSFDTWSDDLARISEASATFSN
jgi:hypothetical protein